MRKNIMFLLLILVNIFIVWYIIRFNDISISIIRGNKWFIFITILITLYICDSIQYNHLFNSSWTYQFTFLAVVSDFLILLFGVTYVLSAFIIVNLINNVKLPDSEGKRSLKVTSTKLYIFLTVNVKSIVLILTFVLLGGGFGENFSLLHLPLYVISLLTAQIAGLGINVCYMRIRDKKNLRKTVKNLSLINFRLILMSILETITVFLLVYFIKEFILEYRITGELNINLYIYLLLQVIAIYIAYLTLSEFEFMTTSKRVSMLRKVIANSLLLSLDFKDNYTKEHSQRVAHYAVMLSKKLGYSHNKLLDIEIAALLHDIGKLYIDNSILQSGKSLNTLQWKQVRMHSAFSKDILEKLVENTYYSLGTLEFIFNITNHHHERFDGTGYPSNLKGEDIPLEARLICVVDAFDAMTHKRTYATKKTLIEGIEELKRCKGTQFDPVIVDAFVDCIKDFNSTEEILDSVNPVDVYAVVYRQPYLKIY